MKTLTSIVICGSFIFLYAIALHTLGLRVASPIEVIIIIFISGWLAKRINKRQPTIPSLSKEQEKLFQDYRNRKIKTEETFRYLSKQQQINEFLQKEEASSQATNGNSEYNKEESWRQQIKSFTSEKSISDAEFHEIKIQIHEVSGQELSKGDLLDFLGGMSLADITARRSSNPPEPVLKLRRKHETNKRSRPNINLRPAIVTMALLLVAVSLWSRKVSHEEEERKEQQANQAAIRELERGINAATRNLETTGANDGILRTPMSFPRIEPVIYNPIPSFTTPPQSKSHINKFSSDGHAKAKGINFSVEYPDDWLASEGNRPNVVQKIFSNYGKGQEGAVFTIVKIPDDIPVTKAEIDEILSESNISNLVTDGAEILSTKLTRIDGQNARYVEFSSIEQRAGHEFLMYSQVYYVYYDRRMIALTFQIGVVNGQSAKQDLLRRKLTAKNTFDGIANSFTIYNQYRK